MNRGFRSAPRQGGISLIELLIGIVVGLIILAGALALFNSMLRSSKTNLAMTNLDQEVRAVMDIMVRNIRRAGYNGRAPGTLASDGDLPFYGPSNPFQTGGYEMTLGPTASCDSNGQCPCITFSYDVVDPDPPASPCTSSPPSTCCPGLDCGSRENLGFRLSGNAIQMRSDSAGPPGCADNDHWEAITDNSVTVDSLTFQYENRAGTTAALARKPLAVNLSDTVQNGTATTAPSGCPSVSSIADEQCLQQRTVIVTIDAHLANDLATTVSIREHVKVPNDRYCTEGGSPSC